MLSKYRQKRQEGFTIIEVLIVLAIAGLILLVVFLAVPALQRNSRNTQRDNDVAGILGGMSEYVNNNNGQLPSQVSAATGDDTTLIIGDPTNDNEVEVNLGYYDADFVGLGSGNVNNGTQEDGTGNAAASAGVFIVTGAECNDSNNAAAGPSRGYVALYTKENGSKQCRES